MRRPILYDPRAIGARRRYRRRHAWREPVDPMLVAFLTIAATVILGVTLGTVAAWLWP